MIESASSEKIRFTSSLSSGLPGRIASAAIAGSRLSRRNSAARVEAAGPWQRKQLSDKIGRISRLKSSFSSARSGPENKMPRKMANVEICLETVVSASSVLAGCAKGIPVNSRFIKLFPKVRSVFHSASKTVSR